MAQADKTIAKMGEQIELATKQLMQAEAASAQTDESIRLTKMQLRAWVGVTDAEIADFTVNLPTPFTIHFRNSGAVPATIVRTRLIAYAASTFSTVAIARQNARVSDPSSEQMRLLPGEDIQLSNGRMLALEPYQIQNVAAGSMHVLIAGEVTYTDVFDNVDTFDFVFRFDPGSKRLIEVGHQN